MPTNMCPRECASSAMCCNMQRIHTCQCVTAWAVYAASPVDLRMKLVDQPRITAEAVYLPYCDVQAA